MAKPQKPQKKAADGQTAYQSIAQAAAMMGLDVSTLRLSKKLGAPGFRGPRVYPAELLPWLEKNKDKLAERASNSKEALEIRRLVADCENREFALAVKRGEFYPRAVADAWLIKVIEDFKSTLALKLKNELPPKLEGLRAPEIAAQMDGLIFELMTAIQNGFPAAN